MMTNKWQKCSIVFFSLMMFFMVGVAANAETIKKVVLIDPAHGGEDQGVIGVDRVAEKDLTLSMALALKKQLAGEAGMIVVLTRETDQTLSVAERKAIIVKEKPDVVLSIHVNAGFGKNASGFELYYPGFKQVDVSVNAGKNKAPMDETKHLNDTVKLARLVRQNFDTLFPRKGRGLREAETPLVEGLKVPTLILEMGFITNPDEKKKMSTQKTQNDIARALARSIKDYF